jgi:prepilin-type N-terminal cleavage/methylation domain-containing protein
VTIRRRRTGYTLLEVLVAVALSTAVLVAAWAVWHLANRSQGAAAAARAIQTAALIEETVSSDLRRLISVGGSGLRFYPEDRSKIGFYAADPSQSWQGNVVDVRAVRYFVDGAPGLLKREVDLKAESVGTSPVTSIAFTPYMGPTGAMVRVTLAVGRDPTEPAGPPHVHTFLARMGHQRNIPAMAYRLLSDFRNREAEAPRGQTLPRS